MHPCRCHASFAQGRLPCHRTRCRKTRCHRPKPHMIRKPVSRAMRRALDDASIAPLPMSEKSILPARAPIFACRCAKSVKMTHRPIWHCRAKPAKKTRRSMFMTHPAPIPTLKVNIDIRNGLAPVRQNWIEERGDTELLDGPSSDFGQARLDDESWRRCAFNLQRRPRRAKPGKNVSQMHYARQGMVTPEMEYIAIRENQNRHAYMESLAASGEKGKRMADMLTRQHGGEAFGANLVTEITPDFVREEVARGRAIIPAISTIPKANR